MPPFRKSPRLREFDYVGPLACHLTFVTRLRRPLFTDPEMASTCLNALDETCARCDATISAYCFMPDHAHVLVTVGEGGSLAEFARRFKQLSGYRLKQKAGVPAWQTSYYDHVLRREESLLDVARYIWENPVKEGLAVDRVAYPFSGPRDLLEQA